MQKRCEISSERIKFSRKNTNAMENADDEDYLKAQTTAFTFELNLPNSVKFVSLDVRHADLKKFLELFELSSKKPKAKVE